MSNFLRPHGLQPARLLCPWDSPGKILQARVGCHFLLQRIFLTQGSNPDLLHCRQILYCLSQYLLLTLEPILIPEITYLDFPNVITGIIFISIHFIQCSFHSICPKLLSILRNHFLCSSIRSNSLPTSSIRKLLQWIHTFRSTSNSSSLAISMASAVSSSTEILNPSKSSMRIGINFS